MVCAGTLGTCVAHFSRPSPKVFLILADSFTDMTTPHGYFFSVSPRLFFKSNDVLCFQGSRNCKKELNYADGQTKSIVPVMCEKGFKAQGWLGIITAGLLWIDFRYIDKCFASFCSTSAVSNWRNIFPIHLPGFKLTFKFIGPLAHPCSQQLCATVYWNKIR